MLFSIEKLLIANASKEWILIDDLNSAYFDGVQLRLKELDEINVIWLGDYLEPIKQIPGDMCCQIKPCVISKDNGDFKLTISILEVNNFHKQIELIGNERRKLP